ncbi:dimethylarginine dimethylaminohydrolase family protein [Yinghuangia seranimata]|uniref:dimethylarginine dimethylaminohydrolase family protein n=1 Tax=Yinghuangia seranimata TaxID=408067 RepID=UPI00248AD94B|nr:amidinotransferase [Yinghuangia seranimata]MDI2126765.1 amidinotransferase [Yinghuangia seranimata]
MRLTFAAPAAGSGALWLPSAPRVTRGQIRLPRPRRRREAAGRRASARHYVMCPPTHLPSRPPAGFPLGPADPALAHATVGADAPGVRVDPSAMEQWELLRETLLRLGHRVSLIPPRSGLPGMVFAAHAATVVDGRVLGARFRSSARQPEAPAYLRWFAERGYGTRLEPVFAHEGEIDLVPAGRFLLAAYGPHTEARAHLEAGSFLGLPVVPLELAGPRFARLGSAIAVLTDRAVAYHPAAFSVAARERLARLFPERIAVGEADALAGGLDAICDGRTVVLTDRAPGLAQQLARHGFHTVPLDMSRFAGFGIGVRSCVLELRDNR